MVEERRKNPRDDGAVLECGRHPGDTDDSIGSFLPAEMRSFAEQSFSAVEVRQEAHWNRDACGDDHQFSPALRRRDEGIRRVVPPRRTRTSERARGEKRPGQGGAPADTVLVRADGRRGVWDTSAP